MAKFHILLVRFSSLGDVVLTTSLPSFLKHRWNGGIKISYLTSPSFAPLLEGHKDIDHIWTFPREKGFQGLIGLRKKVEDIHRQCKIDLILDLHGTLRSLFIRLFFWKIPRLSVDKRTLERWILTGLKCDLLSWQGAGFPRARGNSGEGRKRYGELLLQRTVRDWARLFDYQFDATALSSFIIKDSKIHGPPHQNQLSSCALTYQERDLDEKKWNLPPLSTGSYVCIVPSASFPEKRWPAPRFKRLVELAMGHESFQDMKFVLLAGPEDHFCQTFNELVERYPGRFFNLQGRTDLLESTLFLKKGLFCVGNDTGLPHLSESVGTPAIFILGPTGEEFGFYPHLKSSKMVSVSLWCRPCTTNGKGNCIRSQRYCLSLISEEMVLGKMLQLKKEIERNPV